MNRQMHPRDQAIADQYNAGKTLQAIAKYFGLSPAGIAKVLQRNSVPLRPRGPQLKIAGQWAKRRK